MTTSSIAPIVAKPAERGLDYAESLAKDIPAEKFGHMPHPSMNHPAFNYGHLALYPDRLLAMIGKPELARPKAGWEELFKAGVACVEQDGRYPGKQEIVDYFLDRYRTAAEAVAATPDEVFFRPNPIEGRFKELLPTLGMVANFLLNSHVMMHLGQVSAWRRAVGLPSVM